MVVAAEEAEVVAAQAVRRCYYAVFYAAGAALLSLGSRDPSTPESPRLSVNSSSKVKASTSELVDC